MTKTREHWGSRLGFIMATAGSLNARNLPVYWVSIFATRGGGILCTTSLMMTAKNVTSYYREGVTEKWTCRIPETGPSRFRQE